MATERCPYCGCIHAAPVAICQRCGWELNGAAAEGEGAVPTGKASPEVKEWALRNLNIEECLEGIREIERTGGLELKNFIHELEEAAKPRDPVQ